MTFRYTLANDTYHEFIFWHSHPLLEKLDNTEVEEVDAKPSRSNATHKHVHLIVAFVTETLKDQHKNAASGISVLLLTGPILVVSVSIMNCEDGRKMEMAQIASQTTRIDTPE